MEKARSIRQMTVGDAAVEGLLNGILAGLAMGVVIIAMETVAGVNPFEVLTYFALSEDTTPLLGLFTHIAVSAIYGVLFGILSMTIARSLGARANLGVWLALGAAYGLLILGIAEGIVLPRTTSPLLGLPVWAFGTAHLVYGIVLAWLTQRSK